MEEDSVMRWDGKWRGDGDRGCIGCCFHCKCRLDDEECEWIRMRLCASRLCDGNRRKQTQNARIKHKSYYSCAMSTPTSSH